VSDKERISAVLGLAAAAIGLGYIIASGIVLMLSSTAPVDPKLFGLFELFASLLLAAGIRGAGRAISPGGRKALGMSWYCVGIVGLVVPVSFAYAVLTRPEPFNLALTGLHLLWITGVLAPALVGKRKAEASDG
jgi:hypothetical protein